MWMTKSDYNRFNPRSRVGSDRVHQQQTANNPCFNPRSRVGSDQQMPIDKAFKYLFQSTLPRGERHAKLTSMDSEQDVSIHAPAWGATLDLQYLPKTKVGFNPRSRVGSDNPRS